jgi:carboxylate-amine ligase
MIYFDVRPSSHLPTLELRVTDSCPDIDTVVLIAGLFRALVQYEREEMDAGRPPERRPAPLLRSALWRASRSGLEGNLVDLPRSPRPVPAAMAVTQLVERLRPQLEATGDWDAICGLTEQALGRGSSAQVQRARFDRRHRLSDVVDLLVAQTDPDHGAPGVDVHPAPRNTLTLYRGEGDEAFADGQPRSTYWGMLSVIERLGPDELRRRERLRDEEQRSRGVTFGVHGRASSRLFPVDLLPRRVDAEEWDVLVGGLEQRARALDLFLHDAYSERAVVRDGVLPSWVLEGAPGLNGIGALLSAQKVRAHVCGMDLVKDAEQGWFILEDNLRVPSGLGYAVQNRRLMDGVMPDLPRPHGLVDVESAPAMLLRALQDAALPSAADSPNVVLLSEGPQGPAWFEHRMLGEEMGVPVAEIGDLLIEDDVVHVITDGGRRRVDVLYLRVDDDALLHASGSDGRPIGSALLGAIAASNVALANAPGNGVGDDKAVYGFVPAMIEYYLGEKPGLAGVPTYLCGVPEQLQDVLGRLDELVLKPVDGYGGEGVLIGPLADERALATTRRQIVSAPHRWIAQEVVALTTHPCFDGDERLEPRHLDLRAFVFHGEDVVVAPAALTRVAPAGSMVVNSSRGGGSKDTWLIHG